MPPSTYQRWLHWFCCATAAATFALIGVGGLVTSHGAGMAVPDWPTTYGYNMFLFPVSQWVGGIFYEHSHRLLASWVGLLTTILAVWLWFKDRRKWLRWLGVAAFFGVVAQGVLGGLRVTLLKDQLGIFHATLAQLFLVLVCCITLFTSKWWLSRDWSRRASQLPAGARYALLGMSALILGQLVLGATMRHQHAGLAVPDFPLAYGKVWPDTDPATLDRINRSRTDVREFKPVTAFQIKLHMFHRITAFLILGGAAWYAAFVARRFGWQNKHTRFAAGWFALILLQAGLGIVTVLSNKAADVATAHVVCGAASLVAASVFSVICFRAHAEVATAGISQPSPASWGPRAAAASN